MTRIYRPRFDPLGRVLSTFWPKGCNRYNCRIGALVCRKGRGFRRRGRAYQQALRAKRMALTPAEIDYLVQATRSRVVNKSQIYHFPTPTLSLFTRKK